MLAATTLWRTWLLRNLRPCAYGGRLGRRASRGIGLTARLCRNSWRRPFSTCTCTWASTTAANRPAQDRRCRVGEGRVRQHEAMASRVAPSENKTDLAAAPQGTSCIARARCAVPSPSASAPTRPEREARRSARPQHIRPSGGRVWHPRTRRRHAGRDLDAHFAPTVLRSLPFP